MKQEKEQRGWTQFQREHLALKDNKIVFCFFCAPTNDTLLPLDETSMNWHRLSNITLNTVSKNPSSSTDWTYTTQSTKYWITTFLQLLYCVRKKTIITTLLLLLWLLWQLESSEGWTSLMYNNHKSGSDFVIFLISHKRQSIVISNVVFFFLQNFKNMFSLQKRFEGVSQSNVLTDSCMVWPYYLPGARNVCQRKEKSGVKYRCAE